MRCLDVVFILTTLLVLTGCQHIQLVNHPLPFDDKNNQTTPNQRTPTDTNNKALDGIYILENWF